jgi:hypothetical protein
MKMTKILFFLHSSPSSPASVFLFFPLPLSITACSFFHIYFYLPSSSFFSISLIFCVVIRKFALSAVLKYLFWINWSIHDQPRGFGPNLEQHLGTKRERNIAVIQSLLDFFSPL